MIKILILLVFTFQCSVGFAKEISLDLDQKLKREMTAQYILAKINSFNQWLELYRQYMNTPEDHILLAKEFSEKDRKAFLKATEPYRKDGSFKLPQIKERGRNFVATAGNIELKFKLKDLISDHKVFINNKPYQLKKENGFDKTIEELKGLLSYKEAQLQKSKSNDIFHSLMDSLKNFGIEDANAVGLVAILGILLIGTVLVGIGSQIFGESEEEKEARIKEDLQKVIDQLEGELAACHSSDYNISDTLEKLKESRNKTADPSFAEMMTEKIFAKDAKNPKMYQNSTQDNYLKCMDTMNTYFEYSGLNKSLPTDVMSSPFKDEIFSICGDKYDSAASGLHVKLEKCLENKAASASGIEQSKIKRGVESFKHIDKRIVSPPIKGADGSAN